MFSEIDMTKMLGCLIDNRFAMLGERVFFFQLTVVIPMDINCVSLLIDLFLYWYDADFIQVLHEKNSDCSLSFTFYILLYK